MSLKIPTNIGTRKPNSWGTIVKRCHWWLQLTKKKHQQTTNHTWRRIPSKTLPIMVQNGIIHGNLRVSKYPPENSHSHGKSHFFLVKYHQNGGFSIAMVVYWRTLFSYSGGFLSTKFHSENSKNSLTSQNRSVSPPDLGNHSPHRTPKSLDPVPLVPRLSHRLTTKFRSKQRPFENRHVGHETLKINGKLTPPKIGLNVGWCFLV